MSPLTNPSFLCTVFLVLNGESDTNLDAILEGEKDRRNLDAVEVDLLGGLLLNLAGFVGEIDTVGGLFLIWT